MNTFTDSQRKERAQQELLLAKDYAKKSNVSWELAGEKYDYFKKNSERLKNWKNILSTPGKNPHSLSR